MNRKQLFISRWLNIKTKRKFSPNRADSGPPSADWQQFFELARAGSRNNSSEQEENQFVHQV